MNRTSGSEPGADLVPREDGRRNLPAVPDGTEMEQAVLDGEIVSETRLRGTVASTRTLAVPAPARLAARQGAFVAAGVVVAVRRWHASRTRHERMMRAAEAAGDHQAALDWARQRALERHQRGERRHQRTETFIALAKASPWIFGALLAAPAVLGIFWAIARRSVTAVADPYLWAAHVVSVAVEAISVAWTAATIAVPVAIILALHHLGRHAGEHAPRWAATSADPDADVSIDETTVAQALEALRIPQIRDYLKSGMPLQYLVPCRRDGRGTYAEIRLPAGVTAERIARRRADLASGLYRLAKEVWPGTGAEAAILTLWVADKGVLAEGAGPYPLLTDGFCDVFKGVPFGRTLRGDPVCAPLMERNTLAGGMPGQGKSSAARAIMCGAALDPTAELWIMIPDTNFDFEVMKRRCSRYVMGAEDENLQTIRDWLLDLRDEVQRRGQLLVDFEVPAVTRKLASAGAGLHPLFVLLEEAHIAITHAVYGDEISGLLTDVVKLGRKRGIHVFVSTQAPTKDSMPRDVTRNCSNGVAFAVGDHVANDALLGQGAYSGGHRATELIPGTDRGTALVKGFSGERSEMVQVYFLDVERGHDQVTPIIERSLAEIERLGRGIPGGSAPLPAIEVRDLLADLAEVLGDDDGPVRLADLPPRLRKLAPSWTAYKTLTGASLRQMLEREGARTTNTGNVPRLDPADLRSAIAGRG